MQQLQRRVVQTRRLQCAAVAFGALQRARVQLGGHEGDAPATPVQQVLRDGAERVVDVETAALRGEEVIIARGKTPVVRLVPVVEKRGFRFGVIPELVGTKAPDFLEPMTEEELREWE